MLKRIGKFRRAVSRLDNDKKGTAALEFALVAPVFLGFILAIMETGWLFIRMSLLDAAVVQSSRFIYTGEAQFGEIEQADIEDFICDNVFVISKSYCIGHIALELTVIDAFDSTPQDAPVCSSVDLPVQPVTEYDPGQPSEIIFMRVCVLTKLFMPGLGLGASLDKTDDGEYRMTSAIAFMNEPF